MARAPSRDRAESRRQPRRFGNLVLRPGAHRPEEQDCVALGQAGTRPSAPHDQRTASTYIFGAICRNEGKGAGLVPPHCNTQAMNLHLQESARPSPRQTRDSPARSGELAYVGQAGRSRQCHAVALPPNAQNSTRPRMSGGSRGITGYRTVCSNPTTTSSITAATPGTSSSISHGASSPSECATGRTGTDQ